MKPTLPKPRSDNVARSSSGNLPLGPSLDRCIAAAAAEASDNDDEDAELVTVALQRKPPPQKKKAPQNSTAPRKRSKAARPSKQPPPLTSTKPKKKKNPPRHIPVFPIPESIGLKDDDMDSSSSSEEYGAPRSDHDDDDDELEGMWPSVLQAGARLSEARTWAARPSHYTSHSRKRPRNTADEDDDVYSQQQQPLIQHYDSTARPTALTALKERMRSLVSEALLPVPPDDASQSLEFTDGCHRRLVEAIFEIGMSHASPAVIMEHMVFPSSSSSGEGWIDDSGHRTLMEQVTSERVKSHLQKYRKNKSKSKEEFLREYDRWTHKALTVVGGISAAARTNLVSTPTAVLHMMGHSGTGGGAAGEDASSGKSSSAELSHRLLGGDLPAYLTFSVMLEEEYNRILREEGGIPTALQRRSSHSTDSSTARALEGGGGILTATQQTASLPSAREYAQSLSGARVLLPILSEDERQSSLGISISHVVGLFYSMSHALMKERKKEQQKTKASVMATDAAPPSRAEFPPVRDTSGSSEPGGGAESENPVAKSAAATKPSSATEPHAKQPRHTAAANDYYAASATPTTTSTAGTSADPDVERRRGPPDEERYPTTESSYAAYGPPPPQHHHHHSSSYENSHYNNHHYSGGGGTHPPPPYPPPRYPPPHYSNHPPSDGHPPPPPPPYNNPAHRGGVGGHYGL